MKSAQCSAAHNGYGGATVHRVFVRGQRSPQRRFRAGRRVEVLGLDSVEGGQIEARRIRATCERVT